MEDIGISLNADGGYGIGRRLDRSARLHDLLARDGTQSVGNGRLAIAAGSDWLGRRDDAARRRYEDDVDVRHRPASRVGDLNHQQLAKCTADDLSWIGGTDDSDPRGLSIPGENQIVSPARSNAQRKTEDEK